MQIVEFRFAIEDGSDPNKVLQELTRGMDCILGGVRLLSNGFGALIASDEVSEMFRNLSDADGREVAAALLRGSDAG